MEAKSLLFLVHLLDKRVDGSLAITRLTTHDKVHSLLALEATIGRAELDGPQEVADLLEVGSNSSDLVDNILKADDSIFAEAFFDGGVVRKTNSLALDFAVTTLVDDLLNGLEGGLTIGDVGLDQLQHLLGGLGQTDKHTIVDLKKTKKLKNLSGLGGKLVDTLSTDDEGELGLGRNEKVSGLLGLAHLVSNVVSSGLVLAAVFLSTGVDQLLLGFEGLRR